MHVNCSLLHYTVQITLSLEEAFITFIEDAGQVELCVTATSIGTIPFIIPSAVTFTPGTASASDHKIGICVCVCVYVSVADPGGGATGAIAPPPPPPFAHYIIH